jgi:hypothetical protein
MDALENDAEGFTAEEAQVNLANLTQYRERLDEEAFSESYLRASFN